MLPFLFNFNVLNPFWQEYCTYRGDESTTLFSYQVIALDHTDRYHTGSVIVRIRHQYGFGRLSAVEYFSRFYSYKRRETGRAGSGRIIPGRAAYTLPARPGLYAHAHAPTRQPTKRIHPWLVKSPSRLIPIRLILLQDPILRVPVRATSRFPPLLTSVV